jgi:hypothetical protein
MDGDGETLFRHACKLGLEGIVSKRKESTYRSGQRRRMTALDPIPVIEGRRIPQCSGLLYSPPAISKAWLRSCFGQPCFAQAFEKPLAIPRSRERANEAHIARA